MLKEGTGPVARDGDFCVVEFTGLETCSSRKYTIFYLDRRKNPSQR